MLLGQLTEIVTPAFAISTMLAMGLRLTVGEILAPLRNVRFVGVTLVLNFVALPAAAVLIAAILGLEPDIRTGLVLVSTVAGAPLIPKLVGIAKGDAASAVALVTLLVVATVVVAPVLLPLVIEDVEVDPIAIAASLGWQMLLPLAVGTLIRQRYPDEAVEYVDGLGTISNVTLVLLFAGSIGQNLDGLFDLVGSGGILATVLLIGVAIAGGYVLGIPAGVERRLLALGSAQRNVAAAFIIAVGSFADRPTVIALVATAGLIMMVILFPLAGEWSKRPSRLDEGLATTEDEPERAARA